MNKLDNFIKKDNMPVNYSGIKIIDNQKLLKFVDNLNDDWRKIAHHVTIKMGKLPDELVVQKGKKVDIIVTHIGEIVNKAIAVKVDINKKLKIEENRTHHITLAVNEKEKIKPIMSNKIQKWEPLEKPIKLKGIISEFTEDGENM